jgi:hypothetical protein
MKRLEALVEGARSRCEARRNEFILSAKSEVNHLVRRRLNEMEALNAQPRDKLLEEDEDDPFNGGSDDGSNSSGTSDPLGMMASVMDEEDRTDGISESTSENPGRNSQSASKQRASVRTAKFSKLNVLASIEGPLLTEDHA